MRDFSFNSNKIVLEASFEKFVDKFGNAWYKGQIEDVAKLRLFKLEFKFVFNSYYAYVNKLNEINYLRTLKC